VCSGQRVVEGIYEQKIRPADQTAWDFGLGTFDNLDGEMVMLDGQIYQITGEGILAAEAQLHVASAKIGVATALMFPSFSLNGTFVLPALISVILRRLVVSFGVLAQWLRFLYFRVQLYGLPESGH